MYDASSLSDIAFLVEGGDSAPSYDPLRLYPRATLCVGCQERRRFLSGAFAIV